MSNRFWAGSSSEEEEDHDKSSGSSDEEEQPVQLNTKQTDRKFALAFEESDTESEDEHREVKSTKDRTWDSIREGIVKIKNARKNNDWPLIQDEFNNVNKMIDKSKMLIIQHGLPKFYIKMLTEMEDHVSNATKDKEAIKKMKPVVSRALNQMKLQVRKHNEGYKTEIADCREHPEKYEEAIEAPPRKKRADSSSEEEESDDESEKSSDEEGSDKSEDESEDEKPKPKPAAKPQAKPAAVKFTKADDEESSSEDSLFEKDEAESVSSESEDERKELTGRARWLKKKPTKGEEEAKKKIKKVVQQRTIRQMEDDVDAKVSHPTIRKVQARVEEKLTEEELDKKVIELVATRGRKSTDNREILRQFEVLTKAARLLGPLKEIPVVMHYISSMFDSQRGIDEYMDHAQWYTCYRSLSRTLTLLDMKKEIVIESAGTDELNAAFHKLDVKKTEEGVEKKTKSIQVVGSIESFILRLEDEYNKSLQQINPHTQVNDYFQAIVYFSCFVLYYIVLKNLIFESLSENFSSG
jgi:translation initiation factor 3 subunit C